ncbi:MAG: hypothetical protein HY553_07235 [Elusimicrobia bacterium]|nr:hypothetical protein [Elusimicrobiota bacterium]
MTRSSLALGALVASGCAAAGRVPEGYYAPSRAAGPRIEASVMIEASRVSERYAVGLRAFHEGRIEAREAYLLALRAMLASVFERAELVCAEPGAFDLEARVGAGFPRRLAIEFRRPGTGEEIAVLERPGPAAAFADSKYPVQEAAIAAAWFPLMAPINLFWARREARLGVREFVERSGPALDALAGEIRAHPALRAESELAGSELRSAPAPLPR